MVAFVLTLILSASLGAAADDIPSRARALPTRDDRGCQDLSTRRADRIVEVRPRTLDKEPKAERFLGVLHEVDGCIKPLKVQDKVGF